MTCDLMAMVHRAKAAERILALADTDTKNRALHAAADALEAAAETIIAGNEKDLTAGRENGLKRGILDRLALNRERIAGMADGMRQSPALPILWVWCWKNLSVRTDCI